MTEPLVSIIVTSYCPESKHLLDLCMRSISNLSYKNIETIIVGRPSYLPEYENARTITPPEYEFWNGHGINYGVEHSRGEYLFIVNDDCILTKDCIQLLVARAEHGLNVMPAGNDQQGRYVAQCLPQLPKSNHIGFTAWTDDFENPYPPTLLFADTLCLYAHMVSRELWNKVGPMDDNSGLIDIDWCLRVRQAGHMNAIELSSLVWHFGGQSVVHTLDNPKRLKQREQFQAKWGWVP